MSRGIDGKIHDTVIVKSARFPFIKRCISRNCDVHIARIFGQVCEHFLSGCGLKWYEVPSGYEAQFFF